MARDADPVPWERRVFSILLNYCFLCKFSAYFHIIETYLKHKHISDAIAML